MSEATVATNVHQSLDVHGGLAAQITLNGERIDLLADFFQLRVGQIFDFFSIVNPTRHANFAGAGSANAENSRQAHFSVLVRRNIDTSDTCHVRPL
jgi:hypothetical protein